MTKHSKVQIMHFIDNMQDSKRNLEQIQGRLGKKTKRRDAEEGSLKDLIEEMERLNRDSLAAKFEQGNPKQFIKFLDDKIAFLDSITDVLTELYKIKPESKFDEKLEKWQPKLDVCLDSAWRQLVQISEIQPTTPMLPELNSKTPEIKDFISMRHAITDWVSEFSVVDFSTKLVETKPSTIPKPETRQSVETGPSVITPKQETKPVVTEPPVIPKPETKQHVEIKPPVNKRQAIHNNYEFRAKTNESSRWHALGVTPEVKGASEAFTNKYKNQKDDHLKTSILDDFRQRIENAVVNSTEDLEQLEKSLKNSVEYKVLEKGQGVFTRVFGVETSSVKAFNDMIAEKKDQIPGQEINNSIQNR